MTYIILLLGLLLFLQGVVLQDPAATPCEHHATCNDCLQDPNICVWCPDDAYNGKTRCKQESRDTKWCPGELERNENKMTVESIGPDPGRVIQLNPQNITLKLRPGQPQNFTFVFKPAADNPVDMYFLLDASNTMKHIQDEIATQSEQIYTAFRNITKDIYMGMGSFIDKNALPMVRDASTNEINSFKHRLSLTSDFNAFRENVKNMVNANNRDQPEGGFDALSQVIKCGKRIGWRDNSRRVVILVTDGPYHSVGDGRAATIFEPYDGECHMNDDGTYANELTMDYPSENMINKLAKDQQVTIIFLVHRDVKDMYERLAKVIRGSRTTTFNAANSVNVVNILKDIYEKITTQIKLDVTMVSGKKENFNLVFSPDCLSNGRKSACAFTQTEHTFDGTITLKTADEVDTPKISIFLQGINEKLTLDIEVLNSCKCSKTPQHNSEHCNNQTRRCGVCECDKASKRYGFLCSCVENQLSDVAGTGEDPCKQHNDSADVCSNQGDCQCGECNCNPGFSGKFCECNTNTCYASIDEPMCSNHGTCNCGKCVCADEDKWYGEFCHIPNSVENCRALNEKICNNRGNCTENACKCQHIAKWDKRQVQDKFCVLEQTLNSVKPQCEVLEPCVLCHINRNESCCNYTSYEVLEVFPSGYLTAADWNLCDNVRVHAGCYTRFMFRYDDNQYGILLRVQTHQDCAQSYYIYGGSVFGLLLLIGVVTLVSWKVITEIRDRQEYRKFIQDNEDNLLHETHNPIYTSATMSFRNPAFRKRSLR